MENNFIRTTYPKLNRIKHNDYYLGIVQNLFCSKESESTCYFQFSYQSNILLPFGNEYARLFATIANEDAFHMQLLSETILSLGGDPIFCDNQGRWFGGRWMDYVKDVKQMLYLDIELKEKIMIDYKTAISKIDDMAVKQMLTYILKDEERACLKLKEAFKHIS